MFEIVENEMHVDLFGMKEGIRLREFVQAGESLDNIVSSILLAEPDDDADDINLVRKVFLIDKAIQGVNENSYGTVDLISNFIFGSPINKAKKSVEQLINQLWDRWGNAYTQYNYPTYCGYVQTKIGSLSGINCLIVVYIGDADNAIKEVFKGQAKNFGEKEENLIQNASMMIQNAEVLIKLCRARLIEGGNFSNPLNDYLDQVKTSLQGHIDASLKELSGLER